MKIVLETQEDFQRLLDEVAEAVFEAPQSQFHREYLAVVEGAIERRFVEEIAPNGVSHPALAPSTVRRKGHARILQETNELMLSLTDSAHPDAVVEIVEEPGAGGLSRGTTVEYSAAHDRAAPGRPARPHVGLSEGDVDDYGEASIDNVMDHLTHQR